MSPTRKSVEAFHAAALSAGGTDNGKPGLRTDYAPNYFAAFVVDPVDRIAEIRRLLAPVF